VDVYGVTPALYVHLTCLQSPVFLVNSRNPHFSATTRCFRGKPLHLSWPTFSRSYGGNMPSSLERVLSSALGFSPRPPESVCGTDDSPLHAVLFLGAWDYRLRACALAAQLGDNCPTFRSYGAPLPALIWHLRRHFRLPFSVTPRFSEELTAQEY